MTYAFEFFSKISILVQVSVFILLWLSIISWSVIFNRILIFKINERILKKFEKKFWSGLELSNLFQEISIRRYTLNSAEKIFYIGFKEFSKLYQITNNSIKLVMSRTSQAMQCSVNMELQKLENYVPLVGTIGSISPYIGLLGTVLGILHVFIELGKMTHDATNNQILYIQVIAPGIAEALISTAIGLFVAIPAVVAFNFFNVKISKFDQNYHHFIEEFIAILHHQVSLTSKSNVNQDNKYEETK